MGLKPPQLENKFKIHILTQLLPPT